MEDTAQCVILSHNLGAAPEQELTDKLKEIIHEKNTQGITRCPALHSQGYSNISTICVGPQSVGVLLKDGRICKWTTQTKVQQVQAPSAAPSQGGNNPPGGASQSANRSNLPKFRRVMLSASSFDRFRRGDRGVLIDRGRPMIPASAVPEELIAQAQVVLQGRPREVIVRELQRTNLNVNEAVNNLLSRDDDEEDDEGSEVMLPEELLSLLDPSSGAHPLLDSDIYGTDFEYVLGRDIRRRAEKEKEKKNKAAAGPTTSKNRLELDDHIDWWTGDANKMPDNCERFEMMTATGSELLAVSNTGSLYSWNWEEPSGELTPNRTAHRLIPVSNPIVQISSSRHRVMCLLKSGEICTWLDPNLVGERVCKATEVEPISLNLVGTEHVVQLLVSDHLAVARTSTNAFHWIGLYPFADRPKMWEKERSKSKKHVTFDTSVNDIKEGSEVRTKASPIYAAGCVAVNINRHTPMVGILMESVWSLTEMARFRVLEPNQYDVDTPDVAEGATSKSIAKPGGSRKRRPSAEVFEKPPFKEEVWGVCDVIWIHEQQTQDVATVQVVDGAFASVIFTPGKQDLTYASSLSSTVTAKDNGTSNTGKIRIMRKDELCLISPKNKSARSPRVMQKEPLKFVFSGTTHRKIISAVAESTGIRALTEKRGKLYITRSSIDGKLLSEHLLPVFPPSLYGHNGELPSLVNYGEDSLLLLRDGNGAVHPLVRDDVMGFRESQSLNLPQIRHFGFTIENDEPEFGKLSPKKKLSLVAITGPLQSAAEKELPSLSQLILFCDTEKLKAGLDAYNKCEDKAMVQAMLLSERSDSGCNLIHTAVRLSIATKNKDDADPGTTHGIRLREEETRGAREEARELDQRWQRLIRATRGELRAEEPSVIQAAPIQENAVQSPDPPKENSQNMPVVENKIEGVVSDPKERQKNAIDMVTVLINHPVMAPILFQMLIHRDNNGLTPFQTALNIKAFAAATEIWAVIKQLCFSPNAEAYPIQKLIYPHGSRHDDNPLFILCYNDTCSFTWTGEEHINQDIFECRTCGLTGTLCCCTECAYTCHRNHDCKLKKTSPTAYCDCWEKCPCKALIAGNQDKREALLKELVNKTTLYKQLNGKGEHLMLFLARTLGRQLAEQSHTSKRRRPAVQNAGQSAADPATMPEHDLEPPKFAKFAIEVCLSEWPVMKSLIEVGCRQVESLPPSHEDVLCLNSQNGSTHLDKFLFIILSKCDDTVLNHVIDCIIRNAKSEGKEDAQFESNVARFVRSVLRIYVLLMLMSPTAAAIGIKGKSPYTAAPVPEARSRIAAISVSGLFQIVRPPGENGKETKQMALTNVILRCREVLMRLCPYAVEQAASLADTMLAPVRFGIMRPSISIQLTHHNADPLETLEKFLNNEYDLTTLLTKLDENKDKPQRKRKSSRRDTEGGDDEEMTARQFSDDSDDSDGDEPPSSRRHDSQSGTDLVSVASVSEGNRRKNATAVVFEDDVSDGESSSTGSESDDGVEGHVMVDDEIDEEDTEEDDERFGETSEDPDNENFEDAEEHEPSSITEYPPANGQAAREDHDDEMDDVERREIPAAPAAEDDNARDATHSEDSSTDNNEAAVAAQAADLQAELDRTEEELQTLRRRAAATTSTTAAALGTSRPTDERRIAPRSSTLTWTTRGRNGILDTDEDTDERTSAPGTTQTRAPPSSQVNSGSGSSPAEQTKKTSSDLTPSISQTSNQLSLAFSFTMRVFCDLLTVFNEKKGNESLDALNWNNEDVIEITQRIFVRLQNVWNWMYVVLDKMEAQLRFGNAIMLAGADMKPKQQKKKETTKKADDAHLEKTNTKKDSMDYIIATMRSQQNEAGDDYPLVDVDVLRSLVFVFDAYLSYNKTLKDSRAQFLEQEQSEQASHRSTVSRFFQRSNSMCFPGSSLTDAWNTLDKINGKVPLAEKCHLLAPDSDQTALFAPPPPSHKWNDYLAINHQNGVSNVMNMNLATLEKGLMEPLDTSFAGEMIEYDQDVEMEHVEMDIKPPIGMDKITLEDVRAELKEVNSSHHNEALSRWKNVCQFIAKECHQELMTAYGGEVGMDHLLSEVAKFPVRQSMFRKVMDNLRAKQTRDIAFEVHRDSIQLIRDAFFQLNQTYVRRLNTPKTREDPSASNVLPLGSGRVKVRFHDEPGEGTGVARSFYTALAEALESTNKFPFENLGWGDSDDYLFGNQTISFNNLPSSGTRHGSSYRVAVMRDRANAILSRKRPSKRLTLPVDAEPYTPEDVVGAEQRFSQGAFKSERVTEQITRERLPIAEAIYTRIKQTRPSAAARLAGMFVDLPCSAVMHCLSSPELFKQYMDDAISLLLKVGKPSDLALLSDSQEKRCKREDITTYPTTDDAPLFARTHSRGLFSPVPGKMSPMRLNAFLNVGRIIGLCLSQGELFPLKLARHVLKHILGRPLRWLDLQFYDPTFWESLRQLITSDQDLSHLEMYFTANVTVEEADGKTSHKTVPLKENGENILVTSDNIIEYAYKYAEAKMLGTDQVHCYEAIRSGITDVIPIEALDGLSPEDFRLLLCGSDSVSISTLQAVTTFSDESHAPAETLEKFKTWFWAVVDSLSPTEKQELIFFWTGAPSLPTTPEALQLHPTVMVRPPDDVFLPTANTCISRLYVPLYSSKKLLRAKLQLAIKAKNFGFV